MSFEPPPSVAAAFAAMSAARAEAARAGIPWCETHEVAYEEDGIDFFCARCVAEAAPVPQPDALFNLSEDPRSGTVRYLLPDPERNTLGKFHAGAGGTEVAAAVKARPGTGTQRGLILTGVANAADGLIDEEIGALPGVADTAHRTRRNELVVDGWLVDSGRTRMTESGTDSIVWVLSDIARERLGST